MNLMNKAGGFVAAALVSLTLVSTTAYAADYTVLPNDSLYKIGTLFNTSASTIMSDNNLSSNVIYPGQVLDVTAQTYTVTRGDTIFLIAKRFNISMSSLRKANNKWDDLIMPGQQLIIPAVNISPASSVAKTAINYTPEEVKLLARLITAEAGGESYNAMVGVGGVVVNRVQSTEWPSTISSVIYQVIGEYYQFTPVKNGMINNPPSDAALKAAWAALYDSDPSKGAMFYFDDSSTNQWMWSKPITARIDSMVFVK